MRKQIDGQLNLFDWAAAQQSKKGKRQATDLCCDYCIYDIKGCCDYDEPLGDYCVLGNKAIYYVDVRGLCDDAYCPKCDSSLDEFKYLDCEVCPYCGARIKWDRWHIANDKDNEKLWGPDWRNKYNK